MNLNRKQDSYKLVMKTFLLSIKPKYGYAILEGKKKFELRKCVSSVIQPGDLVIMYFSSPVKAIVGYFRAGRVFVSTPEELRKTLANMGDTGVDEEDWTYVYGYKKVMAIEVKNPRRCRVVTLEELRKLGFRPPISYVVLKEEKAKILIKECQIELDEEERNE